MAEPWIEDASLTVEQALSQKIAVIGEKLSIRRFQKIVSTDGVVTTYIHGGGKIGVLVELTTDSADAAILECGKNVAMQTAALKPLYTSESEVDASYIEHEKEVLMAQAKNEKPDANEKILTGMVMGRIKKEMKEVCLLDQVYVKAEDGKQSVAKYVEEVAKAAGTKVAVKGFVRFETGEGMEKKEENFAEEVAKQMGQ